MKLSKIEPAVQFLYSWCFVLDYISYLKQGLALYDISGYNKCYMLNSSGLGKTLVTEVGNE